MEEGNQFTFEGEPLITEKRMRPLKMIIYGDNGRGKTTFGSEAKNPILMDMEGNAEHIEVARPQNRIISYTAAERFLKNLIYQNHNFNSLTIDSLDSIQTILTEKINNRYSLKELSFGRESKIWEEETKAFLDLIEQLYLSKNMNIIFTAHEKIKTSSDPMVESHDRYELRVNDAMKSAFCNWVNCIFLVKNDVILEDEKVGFGKKKAKDIKRLVLYTQGSATHYAKNTFSLPPKILYEKGKGWSEITKHVRHYYNAKEVN